MSTNRTPMLRLGAIALTTLGAVAVAGNAAATSVPDDSIPGDTSPAGGAITILSTGDPSVTIVLPGLPEVGQLGVHTSVATASGSVVATGSQNQEATIDVVTTIVQDGEIVAVDDDGFQMRRTVTSYEAVDNSVGASGDSYANDRELAELIDIPLIAEVDAYGALQSLGAAPEVTITAEQQAAIDEAFGGANVVGFPDVALGVGAQWQAVLDEEQGLTATYTLSSIAGDDYVIDVAMKGTAEQTAMGADLPQGFDDITGTITGTGQFTGRIGEAFMRTSTTTLDIDFTLTGPGIEVTTDISMVEEETTVPA
jgi:hypothetical protein